MTSLVAASTTDTHPTSVPSSAETARKVLDVSLPSNTLMNPSPPYSEPRVARGHGVK
jgi:hypothetical protein